MSTKLRFMPQDPVIWNREHRGGPGYGERALARVIRINADGRVTILVFRPADATWVIRSVGRAELQRPAADELRRLEEMETQARLAERLVA